MEFRADAKIDNIVQSSTIEHTHEIFVLEALDLGARHTLRYRHVSYVNWVIQFRYGLGCFAYGERVHFIAQANELDY